MNKFFLLPLWAQFCILIFRLVWSCGEKTLKSSRAAIRGRPHLWDVMRRWGRVLWCERSKVTIKNVGSYTQPLQELKNDQSQIQYCTTTRTRWVNVKHSASVYRQYVCVHWVNWCKLNVVCFVFVSIYVSAALKSVWILLKSLTSKTLAAKRATRESMN